MKLADLRVQIIESPGWRTVFAFVIPIASSLFSGSFVSEITQNSKLIWKDFYKAKSFYVLIVFGFCIYFYNKAIYMHEKEISRFLDSDYCTAYMRSKCLPEAAERYKELIRSGNGGELKQVMDELKKVLK